METTDQRAALDGPAVLLGLAAAILVAVSAWGAIRLTVDADRVAAIWVANGLMLAILLRQPTSRWPFLIVAGAVGNFAGNAIMADKLAVAACLAVCNTLEILIVGVSIRHAFGRAFDLSRLRHFVVFALVAGVFAPSVAAVLAAAALAYQTDSNPIVVLARWMPADALGYLVVTPLVLMVRTRDVRTLLVGAKLWRTLGQIAVLVVTTILVFSQHSYPLLFVPMAVLGLVAVDVGPAGTAICIGIVAVIAVAATVAGHGPIMLVPGSLASRILMLQAFIAATVLTKLPLIAILGERDRFERQSGAANHKLRLAESIAEIGHWNLAMPSRDLTWSDGVYRIHGFEKGGFAPTREKSLATYHPDDHERINRSLQALFDGAPQLDIEVRLIRPDGDVRDVILRGVRESDAAGRLSGVFGTIMDVTELRKAERAVAESEARYRLIADNTTDMITQMDLTGRRLFVSPSSRDLLGIEPDVLVGTTPTGWIHPDDVEGVDDMLATLRSGAADRGTSVNRVRHRDGRWLWVEASVKLLRHDGLPAGFVASVRNADERVLQAKALETAKMAAESGARVKAEFLANMSHELRTPLTGMLGIHDLLQGDPDLNARQRRLIELAQASGRSLLTIVNDILDLSKMEAGQMTFEKVPFSLRDLVESCSRLGRESVRDKDVLVGGSVEDAAPDLLLGDPTRLRQIVLNLVTNAIKFTAQGHVRVGAGWRDGRLRVRVTDTGIGIAAEAIPLLFERFSQADGSTTRKFGGTGLGLSICKRLVELQGGDIGVESVPGSGSTFWFDVPMAATDGLISMRSALGDVELKRRRILLAEDNAINQEIIGTILRQKGNEVAIVDDGEAAVSAFATGRFDIVLMDVQMPKMDGLMATGEIRALEHRERRRPTPIVALTANAMVEETERSRDAGMDAHVAKPVDWAKLFATIESMCDAGGSAAAGEATPLQRSSAAVTPLV